jgi:hypothetical protein
MARSYVVSPPLVHPYPTARDANGALKGDALVTYLRQPSVQLAVQLMDGMPLRPGEGKPLTVGDIHCV